MIIKKLIIKRNNLFNTCKIHTVTEQESQGIGPPLKNIPRVLYLTPEYIIPASFKDREHINLTNESPGSTSYFVYPIRVPFDLISQITITDVLGNKLEGRNIFLATNNIVKQIQTKNKDLFYERCMDDVKLENITAIWPKSTNPIKPFIEVYNDPMHLFSHEWFPLCNTRMVNVNLYIEDEHNSSSEYTPTMGNSNSLLDIKITCKGINLHERESFNTSCIYSDIYKCILYRGDNIVPDFKLPDNIILIDDLIYNSVPLGKITQTGLQIHIGGKNGTFSNGKYIYTDFIFHVKAPELIHDVGKDSLVVPSSKYYRLTVNDMVVKSHMKGINFPIIVGEYNEVCISSPGLKGGLDNEITVTYQVHRLFFDNTEGKHILCPETGMFMDPNLENVSPGIREPEDIARTNLRGPIPLL